MKTNSTLRERIGVYVLGLAIGLMIVGLMFMGRYQSHLRREAAREAEAVEAAMEGPGEGSGAGRD